MLIRAFLAAAVVSLFCSFTTLRAELPNIVFIMADDLGWGDASCYNPDTKIPMPNLNKLAAQGMRFTDAHSPSAVCTPTRYGVLTGRYAWRSRLKQGVLYGYSPALIEPDRLTVPKLLKEYGFHSACIGKWHLGLQNIEKTDYDEPLTPGPQEAGFDEFFGIPASLDMAPYVFVRNHRLTEPLTGEIANSAHRRQDGGGFWRAGPIQDGFRHIDVLPRITDEAVAYIERRAQTKPADDGSRQPFFLYFPLSAPHTPWLPTESFQGRTEIGHYGDFTAEVDATLGRVMEVLDRHDLTDNTLLFFTSDNGSHWPVGDIQKWGHRANGPWRGQKADIHEGGHRVPFVARWPGHIQPATKSSQTLCLTDLLATCAAIVGAHFPDDAGEDSFNMLVALEGGAIRPAIVNHSAQGMFSIRQGDWKLILGRGSGGFTAPRRIEPKPGEPVGQLYNLADDVAEANNVYQDHPDIVQRLTSLLVQYQQSGRSR